MKISNPVVVQKELISSVDSKDGSLTIQICEEGGSRLLNNTYRPFSVNISPNPANETINIKITTLEKGPHAIILSDLNGELIWTENWNTSAGSEKDFVYQTDNIASGVYMIKVLSPNDIKQVLINVIK